MLHRLEIPRRDAADGLRVEAIAELGRANHVGEKDSDRLPCFASACHTEGSPADEAEPCAIGVCFSALWTRRHARTVGAVRCRCQPERVDAPTGTAGNRRTRKMSRYGWRGRPSVAGLLCR